MLRIYLSHARLLRIASVFTLAFALAACGSTPTPTTSDSAEADPIVSVIEEAVENSASETDAGSETASRPNLPGPEVAVGRAFHYASLDGTIVSWQLIDPSTLTTCLTLHDVAVSVRLHFENTADATYDLESSEMAFHMASTNEELERRTGEGYSTSRGYSETIEVPPGKAVDETLCAGIPDDMDPATLTLALGSSEQVQLQLPLDANATAEPGSYAESPLNKTITFKDASFTLPTVIATTGVWGDRSGGGQAKAGTRWVLIPTEVDNTANPHLFVESNEIKLEVDGQKLGQEMAFKEQYQAAPYGLEQGLSARGAMLFAVPESATSATLHFSDSSSSGSDVQVPITLPQGS